MIFDKETMQAVAALCRAKTQWEWDSDSGLQALIGRLCWPKGHQYFATADFHGIQRSDLLLALVNNGFCVTRDGKSYYVQLP